MAAGGWVEKSRTFPDGTRERWLERRKPGQPHIREMHYLDGGSQMRNSVPTGGTSMRVVWPDEDTPRTSSRPVSGYRSSATSTPLYSPKRSTHESKFSTSDVLRSAWTGHVSVRILETAYDGFLARQETEHGFERIGDECELGGGLFGSFRNNEFVVADITGRIEADHSARSSGMLDLRYIELKEDSHRHNRTGHRLLGFWHSHPQVDGLDPRDPNTALLALPSEADLTSLESLHERSTLRAGPFKAPVVGIILAPRYNDDDDAGWSRPIVTAFVARGEEDYPAVEFAHVKVEGKRDQAAFAGLSGMRLL